MNTKIYIIYIYPNTFRKGSIYIEIFFKRLMFFDYLCGYEITKNLDTTSNLFRCKTHICRLD